MPLIIVEGKKITHMRESRRGLSWNVQTYQIPLVKLVTLASPLQPHLFLWPPPPLPRENFWIRAWPMKVFVNIIIFYPYCSQLQTLTTHIQTRGFG